MDLKLIYTINEKMKGEVVWPRITDTEWVYFGAADEVNTEIVQQKIDSHFSGSTLYVSWTRQESFQTNKEDALKDIKHILGFYNFVIWNASFKEAIEFNRIGVLRCGKIGD